MGRIIATFVASACFFTLVVAPQPADAGSPQLSRATTEHCC